MMQPWPLLTRARGSLAPLFDDRPAVASEEALGAGSARWRHVTTLIYAHPSATDFTLAVLVAVLTTPWLVQHSPTPGRFALQIALIVPLIWRRRYPVGMFIALSMVASVQWLVGERLGADLSLLVALFTVAERRPRTIALAAAAILEVGVVMATFRWTLAGSWIRTLVFLSTMAGAALLLGVNVRGRRAHLASLVERAERLEHERDQQAQLAAVAERTRIAREMHDVLAHSLAVIISLADGAAVKLNSEPDRAAIAIAHVSDIGRQSLRDTRRLLGVLRADNTPDPTAPQPDVSQLADLIARVQATGLDASLNVSGDPFDVPPGAGLTVYRIVQEALTNSLKHATGARGVHVHLSYRAPELDVEVSDDGRPAPGSGLGSPEEVHAAGHGLAGMRERASVYRGSVDAGPRPEGGWRVRARLPVGPGAGQ